MKPTDIVQTGAKEPTGALDRLRKELAAPTDIAWLVVYRILLGLIFLVEVIRYTAYGWISAYYIEPEFYFKYYGFEWVKPWPGWGMYAHFAVMGIAAVGLMTGLFYRVSAILCFLTFSYVFLLDQADYLNHFYLMCMLAFLMIFLPAHRAVSLDAWRKPGLRSDYVPAWTRYLMVTQLSIIYIYAGIAKLGSSWLAARPLRLWLTERADTPIIGVFLGQEWCAWLFAYGGLAFDLLVVPLLLWRRTRIFGYLWAVAFHLLNKAVFSIGVFPWLMISATLIYFPPDWPRRWLRWDVKTPSFRPFRVSHATVVLLGVWILFNLLVPLRHLLYPGPVNWTEEGHRFSWRMMLRTKSGSARFLVTDPVTKETWEVDPDDYLTSRQMRKMATRPDMLLQFAHFIAKTEAEPHNDQAPLEVRALTRISLDGKPRQPLVDPEVNLAAVERSLKHAKWIVPLKSGAELQRDAEERKKRREERRPPERGPQPSITFPTQSLRSTFPRTTLTRGMAATNRPPTPRARSAPPEADRAPEVVPPE